jgi:hypothetical protein
MKIQIPGTVFSRARAYFRQENMQLVLECLFQASVSPMLPSPITFGPSAGFGGLWAANGLAAWPQIPRSQQEEAKPVSQCLTSTDQAGAKGGTRTLTVLPARS